VTFRHVDERASEVALQRVRFRALYPTLYCIEFSKTLIGS